MSTKNKVRAKDAIGKETGHISFGEMLHSFRQAQELTQADMAETLSISKQELCHIEKERKLVSVERAVKFANVLKVPAKVFTKYTLQDQLARSGLQTQVESHLTEDDYIEFTKERDPFLLPQNVIKQLIQLEFDISSINYSRPKALVKKFRQQKSLMLNKKNQPSVKFMFHLTDTYSAQDILKNGFNVSKSYYKAFGKGINLCPKIKDVLKYKRMKRSNTGKVSIIIARVLIGRSHGNSSDDHEMIREPNGASYSKPKYMRPKKGFDSMYSLVPKKQIWIIPSSARVLPIAEVELISE